MRNLIALSFLFLLACNTKSDSKITKIIIQEKEEIHKIKTMLKSQQDCWNNGDIYGFMQGYWNSEKLMFTSLEHKPTYGWQETYKRYKKSYPDKASMGQFDFEIIEIKLVSESRAKLKGRWELIRKDNRPQGKFWLDLRKIEDNWLITKDSTISFEIKKPH